jgi:hypothetical protein
VRLTNTDANPLQVDAQLALSDGEREDLAGCAARRAV